MTLKICPSCKVPQTTKSAKFLGRASGILWFNCVNCMSTFIIKPRDYNYKRSQSALKAMFVIFTSLFAISCGHKSNSLNYSDPIINEWTASTDQISFFANGSGFDITCNQPFSFRLDAESRVYIYPTSYVNTSCYSASNSCTYEIAQNILELTCNGVTRSFKK